MEISKTSPTACVLIDGDKIRRIRQERGFTQLYVATSLTVTTDTISRWENKHSPSIKQENAEKLAEVLDVDLSEITLDAEVQNQKKPGSAVEKSVEEPAGKPLVAVGSRRFLLLAAAVLIPLLFWIGTALTPEREGSPPAPVISAERFLPAHTSPHLPFPVFIRVHHSQSTPVTSVSFILRESFPDSITVENGTPPFTALNTKEGKWIGIAAEKDLLFGYLAQVAGNASLGEKLVFTGHVLVAEERLPVDGATSIRLDNYHWADRNADYVIDDNEILAIYSFFELFKQMGIDIDEIQRIWAGNGYRWDQARKRFIVVPRETSITGEST